MTTTNKFNSILSGESEPVATKDASSSTLPGKSAEVMSTNTIGENATGNTSRRQ